jgi:hypothetical protein
MRNSFSNMEGCMLSTPHPWKVFLHSSRLSDREQGIWKGNRKRKERKVHLGGYASGHNELSDSITACLTHANRV